jgi:hypothetical protein
VRNLRTVASSFFASAVEGFKQMKLSQGSGAHARVSQ